MSAHLPTASAAGGLTMLQARPCSTGPEKYTVAWLIATMQTFKHLRSTEQMQTCSYSAGPSPRSLHDYSSINRAGKLAPTNTSKVSQMTTMQRFQPLKGMRNRCKLLHPFRKLEMKKICMVTAE